MTSATSLTVNRGSESDGRGGWTLPPAAGAQDAVGRHGGADCGAEPGCDAYVVCRVPQEGGAPAADPASYDAM
jgi:hypothetical protein